MANFAVIDSDGTGFAWQITGLSKAWSVSEYYYACLSKVSFVSGSSLATLNAYDYFPLGGTAYNFGSTSSVSSSYPYSWTPSSQYGSNPITFYPMVAEISTGLRWSIGVNGTIPSGQNAEAYVFTPSAVRPPLFNWTYPKASGVSFNLTAIEWNSLMENINLVRAYKGLFTVWYTEAQVGNYFTAAMYNQAYPAVNGLYNYMTAQGKAYISAISEVSVGDELTANHLNYLRLALNSVT